MRSLLRQVIQNFHQWAIPEPRRRRVNFPKLPANVRKAFILMGVHRSGKTWIFYQIMQSLMSQGVDQTQRLYVNFEDDRLSSFESANFEELLQVYFELYPELIGRPDVYFFLDGVHVVAGWEKFVRRLIDRERMQVYVAGSSAKMVPTTLRGRALTMEVFPLSFREFLGTRPSSKESVYWRHYLECGGFPETVDLPIDLHRPLLQDYINTVVFRDVIDRHGLKNPAIAKLFFLRCMHQFGRPLSIRKLFRKVLGYFEEAYALFPIPLYTFSEKQQQANPRKVYPVDPGVLGAYSASFDASASLENAVFLELRRASADIFYYRTESGREVDFVVVEPEGALALYQVSAVEEGIEALAEAGRELQVDSGTIVTWDDEKVIERNGFRIQCFPFWKWASSF